MAGGITETGEPYSAFVSIYNIIRLHPEPNKIDYNECECEQWCLVLCAVSQWQVLNVLSFLYYSIVGQLKSASTNTKTPKNN